MIDNDHGQTRSPFFTTETPDTAAPGSRESIFAGLGLKTDPFPSDPAAGPFITAVGQSAVLDLLNEWWIEEGSGSLAIVTGDPGSGKTRLLIEFIHVVAHNNAVTLATLVDRGTRRSDAQLLKEIVLAFGGTPTGRTGLELQAEVRQHFADVASSGQQPLLLIDAANFTGSQLEILRSLLTDSPARIVLFGEPDLSDRLARRRSLTAFIGVSISIGRFESNEINQLVRQRLEANRMSKASDPPHVEDEALESLNEFVEGNPRAAVRLMHAALIDALARGRHQVDREMILLAHRNLDPRGGGLANQEDTDLVVQTRFALPGFEEVSPPAVERRHRRTRPEGGS